MINKTGDDVVHLLEATGRAGAAYREFERPSDHLSAPLIDAVFAAGPPDAEPEDQHLAGGAGASDLLSEVFDPPKPASHPEPSRLATPAAPAPASAEAPPRLTTSAIAAPNGPTRRSLGDIRRIILQPSEEAPKVPSTDSLHGLFDRLAG
jgi:hypothetical protein